MSDLSITQAYLICAVNNKGRISGFDTNRQVCMTASGLLELELSGCISMDEKTVSAVGELPADMGYLKMLYEDIREKGTVKLEKLIGDYNFAMTDKKFRALVDGVGESLIAMGLAMPAKPAALRNDKGYLPCEDVVRDVIDKIRAELLEDDALTEDTAALVILMHKAKMVQEYFSKYEQKAIKDKLTELAKSPMGLQVKRLVDYVDSMIAVIAVLCMAH